MTLYDVVLCIFTITLPIFFRENNDPPTLNSVSEYLKLEELGEVLRCLTNKLPGKIILSIAGH